MIFYKKGYPLLFDKIKEIIEKKFSSSSEEKTINNPLKKKGKRRSSRISNRKNDVKLISNISCNTNQNLDEKGNANNIEKEKDKEKNTQKVTDKNIEEEEKEENIVIKDLNDYELNSLSYEDAIKYDQRTYWEYYFSLIRTKQLIVFTFYTYTDYNSRILKIYLFLFAFALFYIVNALFFNDSTMHKI